jgi:DNA-binding transcriptional LysR family regulator
MTAHVTLDQWRVFQTIVEEGGYAQAAAKLNKSQSAISYAVAKMQDQLGIELLVIQGRKAALTEAGELMLRRARSLLEEASGIEAVAGSLNQGWEPEITIAVEIIFPLNRLLHALGRFQVIAPNTRVEVIESVLSGTEDLIRENKVDLGISGLRNLGLSGSHIADIEFHPVCAPSHPLAQLGRKVTLRDLKRHRQIVIRDSGSDRRYSPGWQKAEQRWTFSHMRSAMEAIKSGYGFSWAPISILQEEIKCGKIMKIDMDFDAVKKTPLYLIFPDQDRCGPAARSLANILMNKSLSS